VGGHVRVHSAHINARLDLREGPSLDLGRGTGPPRLIQDHLAEELDPLVSLGSDRALVLMRKHARQCARRARLTSSAPVIKTAKHADAAERARHR